MLGVGTPGKPPMEALTLRLFGIPGTERSGMLWTPLGNSGRVWEAPRSSGAQATGVKLAEALGDSEKLWAALRRSGGSWDAPAASETSGRLRGSPGGLSEI